MARNRRKANSAEVRQNLKKSAKRILGPLAYVLGVLACGSALAVSLLVLWKWVTTAELFALKTVQIEGNERAEYDELLKLSGVKYGDNLITLDIDKAAKRISAHPWVSKAKARPQVFDTLIITVKERRPAGLILLDSVYVISEEAEVFKKLMPFDNLKFPVITGITRQMYEESPQLVRGMIVKALKIASEYEKAGLNTYQNLSEINFSPSGEAKLVAEESGTEILLSQSEELAAQFARLKEVYEQLKSWKREAETITLDTGRRTDRVALKLKQSGGVKTVSKTNISSISSKGEQ